MQYTFWYYDLVVIAVMGLCIWNGIRKGVARTILYVAAAVLSIILAVSLSQPAAEWTYDTVVKPAVTAKLKDTFEQEAMISNVQKALEEAGIYTDMLPVEDFKALIQDTDQQVQQFAQQYGIDPSWLQGIVEQITSSMTSKENALLPEWLTTEIERNADNISSILSHGTKNAIVVLEQSYIRPVVCSILRGIFCLLLFLILFPILRLLVSCIPVQPIGSIDTMMGGMIGCIQGIACLWILLFFTKIVVEGTNGMYPFFTEETIDQTVLFRICYHML